MIVISELQGRLVVIKVSGNPTNLSGEELVHVDDNTWQIETPAKRVIDPDAPFELEIDDSGWEDLPYESVDKLSGTVTFAGDGYADTEDIRVKTTNPTAKYLPMSDAAYAYSYTYNRGVDLMEVNKFRDTHKSRIPGQKFASGTLSQWDVVDDYFRDALTDGSPVVLEMRSDEGEAPQRYWALVESAEMTAAIDSPQEQVVSFISTDALLNL